MTNEYDMQVRRGYNPSANYHKGPCLKGFVGRVAELCRDPNSGLEEVAEQDKPTTESPEN